MFNQPRHSGQVTVGTQEMPKYCPFLSKDHSWDPLQEDTELI